MLSEVPSHEALRTVFDSVEGEAKQIVLPDVDVDVPIVSVTHLPEAEREAEALRIASEEGKKPFDLTRGPLLRVLLVQLNRKKYLLVLAMHHIITDGWSISILFRELTHCYEAFTNGKEPQLPDLPLQYAEYAHWQREYLAGDVLAQQVAYWKRKLAGAQTMLDLPTDHSRPKEHGWRGATAELTFETNVLNALKEFAQSEGATLFMTAERFLADPFREGKGGRVYRTGDRCRFLPDGQIAFMGRIDDQIKVMGHRIEPQEVMAALERHPAVQSSFVCAFPDSAGDQRLLAYIVSRNGTTPKPAELRNFLGSHLPLHMGEL